MTEPSLLRMLVRLVVSCLAAVQVMAWVTEALPPAHWAGWLMLGLLGVVVWLLLLDGISETSDESVM